MRCRVLLLVSVVVMAVVWGLSSCEKMIVDEEKTSSSEQEVKGNLILKISVAGVTPMETTRAEEADLSQFFTTLNLAVYQNGEKVKKIVSQKVTDNNFGILSMQLEPGIYQVLVVAHSSEGNPDFSNLKQIKFTNSDGFSDTFYSLSEIEVKEETEEHSLELTRVTSLLRFVINDAIPREVSMIEFTLTGGSGAFDATTGFGSVRSQQKITFTIDHSQIAPYVFDFYTILWEEMKDDGLKSISIKNLDGYDVTIIPGIKLRKFFENDYTVLCSTKGDV